MDNRWLSMLSLQVQECWLLCASAPYLLCGKKVMGGVLRNGKWLNQAGIYRHIIQRDISVLKPGLV